MTNTQNLYALLGLTWGASGEQIKSAYRQLAKSLHPDLRPNDPGASDRFKEIVAAYWVLSDPARRSAYLRDHAAQNGSFERMYQRARRWAQDEVRPDAPEAGQDILVRLHLTLEEIGAGVIKKVKIRRQTNCRSCSGNGIKKEESGVCPACHGTGRVPDLLRLRRSEKGATMLCRKCDGSGQARGVVCPSCDGRKHSLQEHFISIGIPPGVEDRHQMVIKGQGHEGSGGAASGDLKVIVQQKPHPYFLRRGVDLTYACSLTFSQWLEGTELRLPSPNGDIRLKVEAGLKPEGTLKLVGRGLPNPSGVRGDLLVQYNLCVPKKLSKKQSMLLERLQETTGFSPALDEQGFQRRS